MRVNKKKGKNTFLQPYINSKNFLWITDQNFSLHYTKYTTTDANSCRIWNQLGWFTNKVAKFYNYYDPLLTSQEQTQPSMRNASLKRVNYNQENNKKGFERILKGTIPVGTTGDWEIEIPRHDLMGCT